MKNLILVIAVVSIYSLTACAQTSKDIPEKVTTAFSQKFPDASKIKWGKENATEWEAEFKMNGKEYSANFNADGKWMETEYEISLSEIPVEVKTTLDNESKGYKIGESEVSETVDGKVYEFELKKGETKMEIAIDASGKVLTKEAKGEEEDDEEDDD